MSAASSSPNRTASHGTNTSCQASLRCVRACEADEGVALFTRGEGAVANDEAAGALRDEVDRVIGDLDLRDRRPGALAARAALDADERGGRELDLAGERPLAAELLAEILLEPALARAAP